MLKIEFAVTAISKTANSSKDLEEEVKDPKQRNGQEITRQKEKAAKKKTCNNCELLQVRPLNVCKRQKDFY